MNLCSSPTNMGVTVERQEYVAFKLNKWEESREARLVRRSLFLLE